MKRFRFILLLLFALFTATMSAKSVVFTLKDGTKVYYLIEAGNNPIMTFNNGTVTINDDTYQISDVVSFYISATDDPSGLENVEDARQTIKMQDQTLYIGTTGKDVKVYAINGVEQQVEIGTSGDVTVVGIKSLPAGSYVVKVGKVSFKFNKKK